MHAIQHDDFDALPLKTEYERQEFNVLISAHSALRDMEILRDAPAGILKSFESTIYDVITAAHAALHKIREESLPPLRVASEGGEAIW